MTYSLVDWSVGYLQYSPFSQYLTILTLTFLTRSLIFQEKKKRDALSEEAVEKSRLMEEKEQEERRLKLEQGGIKMIGDNRRVCGTKKEKVQEKLLKKIALPTEEEEKEVVKDHEKTNIVRKIVERECEDKELILDNDETEKLQK